MNKRLNLIKNKNLTNNSFDAILISLLKEENKYYSHRVFWERVPSFRNYSKDKYELCDYLYDLSVSRGYLSFAETICRHANLSKSKQLEIIKDCETYVTHAGYGLLINPN